MNNKSIPNKILHWYDNNKRNLPWRNTKNPYMIWLSEIMLQQTQVSVVIPYYNKWIKTFPTIEKVAKADLDNLLKLWEGLGYYSRCRNFHKAAQYVVTHYKGIIPSDYDLFIALPGVGEYIASAVMSIAYDQSYPAIDGNLKRVISRYLGLRKITKRNLFRIKKKLALELNKIFCEVIIGNGIEKEALKIFKKLFKSFEEFYSDTLNYWIKKPKTIIWFMIFVIAFAGFLFKITPKTLLEKDPDRGVYLVFGKTDESSSFQYTVDKAEKVEKRLIPLLQDEREPYQKLIMRVPGFGRSSQSYNSFIIIALLDNWKDRKESA